MMKNYLPINTYLILLTVLFFVFLFVIYISLFSTKNKNFAVPFFSLDDNQDFYKIRNKKYFSLIYEKPGEISRAAYIGSSVYPLSSFVNKRIRFKAEWRNLKGQVLCSETCQTIDNVPVIDILEIREYEY